MRGQNSSIDLLIGKQIHRGPILIAVLLIMSLALWAACQDIQLMLHPMEDLGFQKVIDQDTMWSKNESPYHLYNDILIVPEATLTIEPGVEVLLGPGVSIYCQGRIVAEGKPEHPIQFHNLREEPWNIIDCFGGSLDDTGHVLVNIFRYCIVEGGRGIVARASAMRIESCTFKNNVSTPIRLEYSSGKIVQNELCNNSTKLDPASGNGGGIMVYTDKEVLVSQNDVHDNISDGGRDGGGGIYAYAYDRGKVSVIGNRIYRNRSDRNGGGLVAYACRVEGNLILENSAENSGGGIYAIKATIKDNRVEWNRAQRGGGIYAENTRLKLNMFAHNTAPSFMGGGLFYYGEGGIENNTFFRNGSREEQLGESIVISGSPVLRQNNVVASLGYALRVQTHSLAPDLDAKENFWGTQDQDILCALIYDWLDDAEIGLVNWKNFLSSWVTEAPPPPPAFQDRQGDWADLSIFGRISGPPKSSNQLKGHILEDRTLGRSEGATYKVTGNLLVHQGVSLNILPGTVFDISPGVTLRVRGALSAEGEKGQPIRFTGNPDMPWGHLLFEGESDGNTSYSGSEGTEKGILQHCIVENGSGIVLEETGPLIVDCIIRRNQGSGITVRDASVRILNNRIVENVSPSNGGGIYAYGSKSIYISKNEILNNRAKEDGGGVFAYGYSSTTAVNLSENRIKGNRCEGDGAGAWASRSSLVRNQIVSNQAGGKGGGLYVTFALLHDNQIADNVAYQGGGIYAERNSSLISNRIIGNRVLNAFGGGVYLNFWGMSIKNEIFGNNLVTGNQAAKPGDNGGIYLNGSMVFEYNLIYGNKGTQLFNANPANRPPLSAPYCYWGTNQVKEIDVAVHDGSDDPGLARVIFTPFAASPKDIRAP